MHSFPGLFLVSIKDNFMEQDAIKRKILSDRYGRFELVEREFTESFLMDEKPRTIINMIISKFDIRRRQIHYPTFYSWLWRYRNKNASYRKRKAKAALNDFKVTDPANDSEIIKKQLDMATVELRPFNKK